MIKSRLDDTKNPVALTIRETIEAVENALTEFLQPDATSLVVAEARKYDPEFLLYDWTDNLENSVLPKIFNSLLHRDWFAIFPLCTAECLEKLRVDAHLIRVDANASILRVAHADVQVANVLDGKPIFSVFFLVEYFSGGFTYQLQCYATFTWDKLEKEWVFVDLNLRHIH
eukprot:TRINITY_DN817_c0_g1_i1.p1 TRINITY_DN817_c0_g1~~TRINITY_DN817_c0_g1_i1.p1  ORF type:complete len:171 (-),score=27.02 TRINITY_DN817_c0_g1_i1:18-530(-)